MRRWYFRLTTVLIVLLMSSWGFAQQPAIELDLSIDQTASGIGATVTVTNVGDTEILINQGFSATQFYLKLLITDPLGNVIVVGESSGDNFPRGPVPVIYRDGSFIRGISWETLEVGWDTVSATDNLLEDYVLTLPGYHCARCEVSAMEFKASDPGNVLNFKWQGVLESDPECFYFEGGTQVKVIPEKWRLKWQKEKKKGKQIKIQIWPKDGMTVDAYLLESIKLNNLAATRLKKTPSKIEAYFDSNLAIETLGNIELYQWYPVIVSGRHADGTNFGGAHNIKIVR